MTGDTPRHALGLQEIFRLFAIPLITLLILFFTACDNGSPPETQFKLTAGDGVAEDRFGGAVAVHRDYASVGAPRDDLNRGAAYVFRRNDAEWSQVSKLTASDGTASDRFGDRFGVAVDISGDYAIVGASSATTTSGDGTGAAYVYKRDGDVWSLVSKLTASDGAAGDVFGPAVAISADHIIVGTSFAANSFNVDSAYIFKRTGNDWVIDTRLTTDDGTAGDLFGASIAISENYAVVGARRDGDNGRFSGAAYLFERRDGTWEQASKLTASDGTAFNRFGYSVAISEDYVIVGAPTDDDNGFESGSAYVFLK